MPIIVVALAVLTACDAFDALYTQIRDQQIDRASALDRVRELLPRIRDDFYARGGTDTADGGERFPVQSYGAESIGGRNGSGYIAKGYDWFDGYKSLGHGFFLEDGTEVYNLIDRNLAVQALEAKPLPKQVLPFDKNDGSGFWWANSLNSFPVFLSCLLRHATPCPGGSTAPAPAATAPSAAQAT